jgi:XRE family transcriptional regulator, fatty acid utilization regulator
MIAERLPASSRLFSVAFQEAMTALHQPIRAVIHRTTCDNETRPLLRTMLTNYAAAALVMPYSRFPTAAEEARYDMCLLQPRFSASFEQVAHRLTTLSRSGEKGVPFFF